MLLDKNYRLNVLIWHQTLVTHTNYRSRVNVLIWRKTLVTHTNNFYLPSCFAKEKQSL